MVPPVTKKQKLDDDTPVVFHAIGQKPDVRLKVFDKFEFHVHSVVLKLHSRFFLTFLDSPEKEGLGTKLNSSGAFKYEWESRIDADGKGWHLAVSAAPAAPTGVASEEVDMELEVVCFHKLLCALYADRYNLSSSQELLVMTRMADYYRCLPILSRTLDSALLTSHRFVDGIAENSCDLLICAAKLRNATMFRECLVWAVSYWHDPVYKALEGRDRKLFKLADAAYNAIGQKVARELQQITLTVLQKDGRYPGDERLRDLVHKAARESSEYSCDTDSDDSDGEDRISGFNLARYLRNIQENGNWTGSTFAISKLLMSNLVLGRHDPQAGMPDYSNCFFCAEIGDEDLPWDLTEKEW